VSDRAGFPAFAAEFPGDPRLEALTRAFVRGDYAKVRRDAAALLATGPDEEVRRAVLALSLRTRPDPMMVWLLVLPALLLAALSAFWVANGR